MAVKRNGIRTTLENAGCKVTRTGGVPLLVYLFLRAIAPARGPVACGAGILIKLQCPGFGCVIVRWLL